MEAGFPRVTVVIPTHNRWLMLRSAVWSALNQDGVGTRVVVVDDRSEDETPERLRHAESDRLTVLRTPRTVGVSTARNIGLEHVQTEWVAFLDDDDIWAPFHLRQLTGAIDAAVRAGRRIDLGCSGSVAITLDREVQQVKPAPDPARVRDLLSSENALATPSRVLARTAAVRDAGGFDPSLSVVADWDLWLRLARAGGVAVSPPLSVGYTKHEDNMHLAAATALRELPTLDARYRRNGAGPTLTQHCSRWIATCYRTAGNRRQAARWYLRSFRHERRVRDLARAAGMLVGERAIELSRLRRSSSVPPGIAPWLDCIRAIDLLPPEEVPFGGVIGCAEE